MFEYHGWATLEDCTDRCSDWQREQQLAHVVQRRIDSGVDNLHCVGVKHSNCITFAWFHGQYNHRRSGPLDFMRFIGEQASGAYGLLYQRETEEADTFEEMNQFEVWRLARGEVRRFEDLFLSPCIPTIEDSGRWFAKPEGLDHGQP